MLAGYQSILIALIPVYLFILSGFVFRKVGWLTRSADESLLKIQINFLYPCLIFSYIFRNEALQSISILTISPAVGFSTIILGFAVSYMVAKSLGYKNGKGLRTFSFSSGIYNYGFIAIPLVNAVFDNPSVTGTLVVYNTGIELAIWTVGVLLLTGSIGKDALKKIINPPVIALLIGLAFNLLIPPIKDPISFANRGFGAIMEAVSWLGNCSIPFALILVGASVKDLVTDESSTFDLKTVFGACLARLTILPICFILTAMMLPLPGDLKSVLIIQAAMPAGMFPIIMARKYSGSPDIAVQIVLSTTFLSLLTIPLWVTIGQHFIR